VRKIRDGFGDILYDAVFTVTQSSTAAFLTVCARSPLRIGMTQGKQFYKGSRILFDRVYRAQLDEHMTRRIERQFALFNAVPSNLKRFVAPSMPPAAGRFLLIHPGSKWIPKRWPVENFKALALKLRQNGIPVTVAAHTSEPDLISCFSDIADGNALRFVLTPDITSLMELTAQCSVYVGNDSGPTHMAHLFAKPLVVLWGPAPFERIVPIGDNVTIIKKDVPCRPCRQKKGATKCALGDNICLSRISVAEVYDAVLPLWEKL
jgi:ADP-heptose:LPS heptosyltransferase